MFTTLEITRGWLSNGVSEPTTINGGDGNDQFTVFHNIAVLNLNGGDGDDVFTVRAFALKGSTDSERARTDMKGDGGADTILYVVNAPVGIDGGDGFDTVRIIGTEFADDFVVTDAGIFGAGLNVSYVNIEKLVADGAEGDDRFFVQSTGLEVVTEIDGGLGSDTFFVGGNPSRAPVPVISNDFRGHSGIILHSVESGQRSGLGSDCRSRACRPTSATTRRSSSSSPRAAAARASSRGPRPAGSALARVRLLRHPADREPRRRARSCDQGRAGRHVARGRGQGVQGPGVLSTSRPIPNGAARRPRSGFDPLTGVRQPPGADVQLAATGTTPQIRQASSAARR